MSPLLWLALTALVRAQEDPVERAMDAVARYDYGCAIDLLEPFVRENPKHARAWYLLGYARNRVLLWESAREALTRVRELGGSSPALFRELGMAELGLGNAERALELLRNAPKDDADAAFARARAHLMLRNYERALEALDETIRLHPPIEAHARLLRARALAALGRAREAQEELERGLPLARGTELEAPYRTLRSRLEEAPGERGLLFGSITLGLQYNDNVLLLADDAALVPPELSDQRDGVAYAHVRLESDLARAGETVFGLSAQGYLSQPFDLDTFDVADLLLAARISTRAGPWSFEARGGAGYTWLDADSFRRTWLATGSVGLQPSESWEFALTYTFQDLDLLAPALFPEEDRDGLYHSLSLGSTLRLAEGRLALGLRGLREWADAEGSSVRYRSWGAEASVAWRFAPRWTARLAGRWREIDYTGDNIRNGFTEPREDREWRVSGAVSWRIAEHWAIALDGQHLRNESNLPSFFEYTQNVAGISATYLF